MSKTETTKKTDSRIAVLPPVRVTLEEKRRIKDKAEHAGLFLSEYQRRACLQAKIIVKQSNADPEVIRQLLAIGNNVNQLARQTNIHGQYEREHLEETLALLKSVLMPLLSE